MQNIVWPVALTLGVLVVGGAAWALQQQQAEFSGQLMRQQVLLAALQNRFGQQLSSATQATASQTSAVASRLAETYKECAARLTEIEGPRFKSVADAGAALAAQLAQTHKELFETRSVLAAVQKDGAATARDLAGTTSALAATCAELDRTKAALSAAKTDLAAARNDLLTLRMDLGGAKADLADLRARAQRKVLDAEAFYLVDKNGQRLGALAADGVGPALVIYDRTRPAVERLRLGVLPAAGAYGLGLNSEQNVAVSTLYVQKSQPHLTLAEAQPDGRGFHFTVDGADPRMVIEGRNHQPVLTLGLDHDGAYTDLYTIDGKKCVTLNAPRDGWGLMIMDDATHGAAMMSIVAHKPALTVFDSTGRTEWSTAAGKHAETP